MMLNREIVDEQPHGTLVTDEKWNLYLLLHSNTRGGGKNAVCIKTALLDRYMVLFKKYKEHYKEVFGKTLGVNVGIDDIPVYDTKGKRIVNGYKAFDLFTKEEKDEYFSPMTSIPCERLYLTGYVRII